MSLFSLQNTLALGREIKCEVSLRKAILSVLQMNPARKKKVLEMFREIAVRKGLKDYAIDFYFQEVVDMCELESAYEKLEIVFMAYELTHDPITKLWLKNKLLKNFPRLIKNKEDFEQVCEYFREKMKLNPPERENQLTSLDDFDEIESLDFLVPNLIPKQGLVLLTGQPKVSKSSLACEIAYSLVTGNHLFNQPTTKSKVLVVSLDETERETQIKYVARGFKKLENDKDKIKFLREINSLAELEKFLKKYRTDLVIFDSLQQLASSFNISENSAKFGDFLSKLKKLLEKYNSAGLIIHHAKKATSGNTIAKIRGSSAIAAATSVNLFLEAKNNEIILTATGRDIASCEYKLTLNERKNWATMGVYNIVGEIDKPPEAETEIIKQENPLSLPQDSDKELIATVEEIQPLQDSFPIPQDLQISIPKKRPSNNNKKLTISQKIKTIVESHGQISKEEITKEAVKIAISEQQLESGLKRLEKSGEIAIKLEPNLDNNLWELFNTYYQVCK